MFLDLPQTVENVTVGGQLEIERAKLEAFADLAASIREQRDGPRAATFDAQENCSGFGVPTHALGMLADSGRERQVDAERGAVRDGAADLDGAAIAGDEFAGDGQAKPGPFLFAGEVRLENLADVLGGDATAAV